MNKSSQISLFRKSMFFALGLLVAAFVVSQEVIERHCSTLTAEMEQEEQQDEESSEAEISMLACDVFLPGSSITLEPFTAVFIRQIIDEDEQEKPIPQIVKLDSTPYFKTLFRQIISPNAP